MLATEETKTVTEWKACDGTIHPTRLKAEQRSVGRAIGVTDNELRQIVHRLNGKPEARQWLLEQLGVEPMLPKTYNYEYLATELLSVVDDGQHNNQLTRGQVITKLKHELAPYVIPGWSPGDSHQEPTAYTVPTVEQLQGIIISLDAAHHPLTDDKAKYLHQLLGRVPNAEKDTQEKPVVLKIKDVLYAKWPGTNQYYKPLIVKLAENLKEAGYQLIKK